MHILTPADLEAIAANSTPAAYDSLPVLLTKLLAPKPLTWYKTHLWAYTGTPTAAVPTLDTPDWAAQAPLPTYLLVPAGAAAVEIRRLSDGPDTVRLNKLVVPIANGLTFTQLTHDLLVEIYGGYDIMVRVGFAPGVENPWAETEEGESYYSDALNEGIGAGEL